MVALRVRRGVAYPRSAYQDTLHLLHAHVNMLNHSSIEHPCRNIPPPTLLLQVVEALEDDAFPIGEPVSNVGKMLTRITGRHMKVSPAEPTRNFVLSVAVVHGEVLPPSFSVLLPSPAPRTVE